MSEGMTIPLERDCDAVQIPAGNTVTLPAGTEVDITQNLGGSFTVSAMGGLFSIQGKDADALGLDWSGGPDEDGETPANEEALEKRVWRALKKSYDPEIPVNIVDLGLVYDVSVSKTAEAAYTVGVKMTLTAPGCGMGPMIAADAQQKILEVPGVEEATVELVWDPPWHQSMITPAGRRILGLE
ncbi:MAG: putative Fe-S cluster assembly protein SufT [Verrucomicrobiales bacterium]|nr:putative Fe-S cluster assembly protein SufT [Verrucomicrobiales bacterium]